MKPERPMGAGAARAQDKCCDPRDSCAASDVNYVLQGSPHLCATRACAQTECCNVMDMGVASDWGSGWVPKVAPSRCQGAIARRWSAVVRPALSRRAIAIASTSIAERLPARRTSACNARDPCEAGDCPTGTYRKLWQISASGLLAQKASAAARGTLATRAIARRVDTA